MFFIFDEKGAFQYMICPFFIEACEADNRVLYVQDSLGHFCTLTFPNHELLAEAMTRLRDSQRVCVYCGVSFSNPFETRERDRAFQCDYEQEQLLELE